MTGTHVANIGPVVLSCKDVHEEFWAALVPDMLALNSLKGIKDL